VVSGAELRFDGRVAVVTGAGRGLGKQYALLLAARGARVVVNDAGGSLSGAGSDATAAESVAHEIAALGGEAIADDHSVATSEGAVAIVSSALQRFGRVDIVVNNAGIVRDGEFADMSPELLDPLLDVHLRGTFHVTRAAWPEMIKQGYGRVVNTCSAAALLGVQNMSNYGAAKGGVFGLTRTLAVEGAPLGINVNAVAPIAWTRMLEQALATAIPADAGSAQMLEELSKTFLTAFAPELVSPVVAYLAHEDCPVSGEVYSAGGGQVSQLFMGRTQGYRHPALTIELVREHFAQIRDQSAFSTPANTGEEMAQVFAALAGDKPSWSSTL
jgi:NAD(P)-dependent dehydrogenase (short-subunit alcohol dehydrogenase family)